MNSVFQCLCGAGHVLFRSPTERSYCDFPALGRDDFLLLVGLGALLVRSLRAGSAGAVLGIANLRPELCVRIRDAVRDGRLDEADALQSELTAAEDAAMAFPDLKREVSERLRSEAGIDYGPLMRAPLGPAGRPVAHRA